MTSPACALALAIVLALTVCATPAVHAQTFTVIRTFTGGGDGAHPFSTLTLDPGGNLYGTTTWGGPNNCSPPYECGTVFKLTHRNSAWVLQTLYTFDPTTGSDGYAPAGQLARDPSGLLYGTTQSGGPRGEGTVFEVRPSPTRPVSVVAPWLETRIHDFDFNDGEEPIGDLLLDSAGNLYGTTCFGGLYALGTVYKLTPFHGGWSYAVLYNFTGGNDGGCPHAGVVLDAAGNLYGTASQGGSYGDGAVYQVTPSGSETVLYNFTGGNDGSLPYSGVIFDRSGNLYGATTFGGSGGSGVVFELSPGSGGWSYTEIYPLPGGGWGSYERLVMDGNGNLYGTMYKGSSSGYGAVFKLTASNGGWTYTSLHDFTDGDDGANPYGGLVLDSNGNLYGTAAYGGSLACSIGGCGVVFEITP
jgi:uncharacterized repeat protein (TIGR03803 family)